jgi:hypothetical protein
MVFWKKCMRKHQSRKNLDIGNDSYDPSGHANGGLPFGRNFEG